MGQLIADKTNVKTQQVKYILLADYNKLDKNTFIHPLDQRKFYAFIGLFCAHGLLGQSMHTYKMVFSETAGHSVFNATMWKHRFSFLCSVISFDDPEKKTSTLENGSICCSTSTVQHAQ